MAKKISKYPAPSHHSNTKPGTRPNASKKHGVPGTGRNRPAKGYNPITKDWER